MEFVMMALIVYAMGHSQSCALSNQINASLEDLATMECTQVAEVKIYTNCKDAE